MSTGVSLESLIQYCNDTMQPERYNDACVNGLQVQGKESIQCLVSGVSASYEFLKKAISLNADAVMVHHGYFWKGENPAVVGLKKNRLALLLKHNVSLIAYHLPLDGHDEFGNNVALARKMHWEVRGRILEYGGQVVGCLGSCSSTSVEGFLSQLERVLNHKPLLISSCSKTIKRIAWCTGAAGEGVIEAAKHGVDAYVTGEISERCVHLARELDVALIAAGHHATERYGVWDFAKHCAQKYKLRHEFIEVPSPV